MFEEVESRARQGEPHRALYLKWRPSRFEDVVGQEHVTRTLRNAVSLGRPSHAYLFTGPRGTGKTSVARILYRAVNCLNPRDGEPDNTCEICEDARKNRALDLVEIDAASNRGIDDMRALREKVGYRPTRGSYRVYIIDEAHRLTAEAWEAFLKTLEEPPPHALFVLATTDAHKVPATIVSRCQRFDFRRIPFAATRDQLARVAAKEGLRIEPAVLERLALVARGGLRDALSLLDQLSAFAVGDIDLSVARAALSLPSIEAVRGAIDAMTRRDPAALMAVMSDAAEGGADLRLLAEELVVDLRALLLLRAGADVRLTDELPVDEVEWLRERAPAWSAGTLMQLIQTLSDALARTRDAAQFQVQTEVALLSACDLETRVAAASPAPAPVAGVPSAALPRPAPTAEATEQAPGRAVTAQATGVGLGEQAPTGAVATRAPGEQAPFLAATDQAPALADAGLASRWPDVIEHVKSRNPILASLLGSAQPVGLDGNSLLVAFASDFNRKSAESRTHRQLIETAFERVFGAAYRLKSTVANGSTDGLLDDPVINFAQRTFGGQPRRLT